MFQIDLKNKKSIYEQITDGFKNAILSEELKAKEKLPSVRELSARLTVNPNTIQKAYGKLEQEGWIYTVTGRGAFVSEKRPNIDENQIKSLYSELFELISQLFYFGEKEENLQKNISDFLQERKNHD